MAKNIEFVQQRTIATRAAQVDLAAEWVWEEKTVANWDTDLTLLNTLMEAEQDAEAAMLASRGETDAALDQLHSLTGRCLRMAKNRYRDDAARMAVFYNLRAEAGSRAGKLQEALEWESAWEKTAATWSPLPNLTLAAFKASRLAAAALLEAYATKRTQWESADAELDSHGRALNGNCVAWYEAATIVFDVGTPAGDMIRSSIPTTYTPPSQPPSALQVASAVPGPNGVLTINYVAGTGAGATQLRYELTGSSPAGEFSQTNVATPPNQVVSNLPPGATLVLRTLATNSAGTTIGPSVPLVMPAA